MSLKWWEKTVEYKFIMLVASKEKLFLSPLDGDHERAGDAIFSSQNRWILIEFKKNADSISDEKNKFLNYVLAKRALSDTDKHHYLVYGKEVDNRLGIFCRTYFSDIGFDLSDMLTSGVEFDFFVKYVEQFMQFKKTSYAGSGGGLNISDFALVAGINSDNNIVSCLSLSEFRHHLKLDLNKANELHQKREHERDRGMSR
jgi:hypothetical protein